MHVGLSGGPVSWPGPCPLGHQLPGREAKRGQGRAGGSPPTSRPSGASVQAPRKRLGCCCGDQSRAGFLKPLQLIRGGRNVSEKEIWKQLL